ncbi:acyltransferase [Shewanella basaltis]|uniref:acyltransferase n=1 Tax=Shewanella basaltis TaxID=472183 RepID=UPI0020108D2D|nr:acyltransferase [Shewanella basaltis]MCL1112994.1 acyltransferase [Shewanella basaltis]
MAYYTEEELSKIGFKKLGLNVKVSVKASIYNPETIEIDDNSRIDDFCTVSGSVTIGKHVHFAPYCLVAGGTEGIIFGDFSGLAYNVQVFSQSDDYSGRTMTNPTIPSKYKKETKKSVQISRHVIVGTSSIIFPGVTIAEGCSIGAMSLVNKSTEPWGIYIGNPAKRVKYRHKDLLDLETLFASEKNDSI